MDHYFEQFTMSELFRKQLVKQDKKNNDKNNDKK